MWYLFIYIKYNVIKLKVFYYRPSSRSQKKNVLEFIFPGADRSRRNLNCELTFGLEKSVTPTESRQTGHGSRRCRFSSTQTSTYIQFIYIYIDKYTCIRIYACMYIYKTVQCNAMKYTIHIYIQNTYIDHQNYTMIRRKFILN